MDKDAMLELEIEEKLKELLEVSYKNRIINLDNLFLLRHADYSQYIKTAFVVHNRDVLLARKSELKEKEDRISNLRDISTLKSSSEIKKQPTIEEKEDKEFSFYELTLKKYEEIKLLSLCEQDVIDCLDDSNIDLSTITLLIYRDINELITNIRNSIILEPGKDVSAEQVELNRLRMIMNTIKNYKKLDKKSSKRELPNVILLEDNDGNDCVYNFINSNIECIPKVKKNLEKFFRGELSSVKRIKGKSDDLCELTDVNGTRLLFFNLGNTNYVLARIFIKDATRSLKIDAIYDKAIADFRRQKEYIINNINNEEFKNKQFEMINRLFRLLNNGDEAITDGRQI